MAARKSPGPCVRVVRLPRSMVYPLGPVYRGANARRRSGSLRKGAEGSGDRIIAAIAEVLSRASRSVRADAKGG